ncbi:hypothetical protein S7711_09661 [Stachybotrys chartarum IBT 7711]|uniref:Uncharacterized protein n=1 Tax=Stachybotrys chartarum (strain CBS 109288 / IBT 7711) TaxID=1280523 RepID=A0A084B7T2_STACB|nr:hypothetical protein S7711_09661 [Stachybotrys chartarum IBT 7711]
MWLWCPCPPCPLFGQYRVLGLVHHIHEGCRHAPATLRRVVAQQKLILAPSAVGSRRLPRQPPVHLLQRRHVPRLRPQPHTLPGTPAMLGRRGHQPAGLAAVVDSNTTLNSPAYSSSIPRFLGIDLQFDVSSNGSRNSAFRASACWPAATPAPRPRSTSRAGTPSCPAPTAGPSGDPTRTPSSAEPRALAQHPPSPLHHPQEGAKARNVGVLLTKREPVTRKQNAPCFIIDDPAPFSQRARGLDHRRGLGASSDILPRRSHLPAASSSTRKTGTAPSSALIIHTPRPRRRKRIPSTAIRLTVEPTPPRRRTICAGSAVYVVSAHSSPRGKPPPLTSSSAVAPSSSASGDHKDGPSPAPSIISPSAVAGGRSGAIRLDASPKGFGSLRGVFRQESEPRHRGAPPRPRILTTQAPGTAQAH